MADLPPQARLAVLAVAITAVSLLAWPVIGQQSATEPGVPASETDATPAPPPKSLLPDAFDTPAAETTPDASLLEAVPAVTGPPLLAPPPPAAEIVDPFAVPVSSGRDITVFGPLTPETGGYGLGTFTGSRGAFLAGLANRINAPIGSRWAAITLRRALLSESAAPYGIVPGDWVASRAWLLMRMGEIDGAKAITDRVPVDRYSPALYRVAGQVALAAADINGLCPIAQTGQLLSKDPLWQLAIGMCAAIQGDDITAARVFDDLREDEKRVEPFDVRLGERVATIAGGAGRATNIDWAEAPVLTPYRYGVATGAGVTIPAGKFAGLGPAYPGWVVRAPGVDPAVRLAALGPAAVLGTMSVAELTSGVAALSPGDAAADTRAGRLRTAFAGASMADRRDAIKAIWAGGGTGDGRYAALLESAPAVARLPVSADNAGDSADIISALLAAGDADAARRWWPIADKEGGKVRAQAWALLATGSGNVPITPSDFSSWRSASGATQRQAGLLFAALAGLGAANGGEWESLRNDLLPRATNSWSRAIDAAGTARRTGEVAILAGTGLQGTWAQVPPMHLYHIIAALNRVGRGREARLIAAEALTRG